MKSVWVLIHTRNPFHHPTTVPETNCTYKNILYYLDKVLKSTWMHQNASYLTAMKVTRPRYRRRKPQSRASCLGLWLLRAPLPVPRGTTRPRPLFLHHPQSSPCPFPSFTLHWSASDASCIVVVCLFVDHPFFTTRMSDPPGQESFVCFVHHCISCSLKSAT